MRTFRVERMVLGMIRTNCYLLIREDTGETLIVDPADRADRIEAKLTEEHLTPCGVLLTHGHFDHIGAAEELRKRYGIRIYLPEKEEALAGDSFANLSGQWASPFGIKADVLLKDGETLELAGFSIEVKATPGHTGGSACYYLPDEKILFSGDTLFAGSVGRSDFPTGSAGALARSVKGLLSSLPEEVHVYPGHEGDTSIAYEKRYNPYA
ncbi:MAG: MBL fold metallo-hydrolase [Lachnospiraceae bacterium]